MRILRLSLSVGAVLFLLGGYLASQYFALQGQPDAVDYATKADSVPVRLAATLLVVGAVALAFVRERDEPK